MTDLLKPQFPRVSDAMMKRIKKRYGTSWYGIGDLVEEYMKLAIKPRKSDRDLRHMQDAKAMLNSIVSAKLSE